MATKIKTRHIMDKITKEQKMQKITKVSNKIKWYFVKLTSPIKSFKKWFLADITQTFAELNNNLDNRVDMLECQTSIDDVEQRVENIEFDLESRIESVEDRSETNQESIRNIRDDVRKIIGVDFEGIADRFNGIDDRVNNLEELAKKYLNAELQAVVLKQEKTEASLSAMQKLSFEICKYYGGDFNLDDFNNCYDIINKYNVKEGK